jgi:hypothetical protein
MIANTNTWEKYNDLLGSFLLEGVPDDDAVADKMIAVFCPIIGEFLVSKNELATGNTSAVLSWLYRATDTELRWVLEKLRRESPSLPDGALQKIVDNRIAQAKKWHGLEDGKDVAEFLMADPDVQERLKDPAVQKAMYGELERIVLSAGPDQIPDLRLQFGDKLIDRVLNRKQGRSDGA